MPDDLEIIGAVLQGEAARYGELVSKYQFAAWKLAYSFTGDWEEAKDLSQNGFVKAYHQLRRFRGRAKFSTWLYRIVTNECKDFLRRSSRRPETVPLAAGSDPDDPPGIDPADPAADPREAAHRKELAGKLARAIGRLPVKQQSAFILHRVNGLSLEEVSEAMGCRPGTVKAHLFRASETLRLCMEPFLRQEA